MTESPIEFQPSSDPGGSARQQRQAERGLIGTLAEHHGIELVTREDFAVPFNPATGEPTDQEPAGGVTGFSGISRPTGSYKPSLADWERTFPVMRGRVPRAPLPEYVRPRRGGR